MLEVLKALLMGVVQGITEWLPVSSGGHLMLLRQLLRFDVSEEFWNIFDVIIQLGSILAVVVIYFRRLNPFARGKRPRDRRRTWQLWGKIVLAVIPSAAVGLVLNDWIEEKLSGLLPVAVALIVYGVIFLFLDRLEVGKHARRIQTTGALPYRTAFLIGCFQVLALLPGTSRSGSTIIGALLLTLSRTAAVEFSFFMAIPTMLGASLLKCLKFVKNGGALSGQEAALLAAGCVTAFLVSLAAIRALVDYVRTHSFRVFGLYRILLGAAVLALLAADVLQ